MKNLIIITILVGLIASCTDFAIEDQDFNLQELPSYVAFGDTGGTTDPAEDNDDEGETVTFRLYVPTNSLSDITVNYTLGGSATFGTDYTIAGATASGGSILLPYDGRLSSGNRDVNDFPFVDLDVVFLFDAGDDDGEDVIITLTDASNSEGTVAIGRGGTDILRTATATIDNLDLEVKFGTTSKSTIEGVKDTTAIVFVSNFAAPEDVTITLAAQGDAVLGTDFAYLSGNPLPTTVVLLKGTKMVEVDKILVVNDVLAEAKDSTIYALTAATIGGTGNKVVIGADTLLHKVADDSKVITMATLKTDTLSIASANDAGNHLFSVSMGNTSTQSISIGYTITGGTAGVDYIDVSGGTVTFAPGQTETKITINIPASAVGTGPTDINVALNAGSLAAGTDTEAEVDATANNEFNIKIE